MASAALPALLCRPAAGPATSLTRSQPGYHRPPALYSLGRQQGRQVGRSLRSLRLRAEAGEPALEETVAAMSPAAAQALCAKMDAELRSITSYPPSQREEVTQEKAPMVRETLYALQGVFKRFNSMKPARRQVFMRELTTCGLKNAESIGTPSVRNDLAFLVTTVGVSSVGAVAAGALLPGDWGFFSSYLIGGVSLVVLAVGSVAPGLLTVFTDQASRVFPDYRDRILRHESAHFLLAYYLGVPVCSYSLDLGKQNVSLFEARLQRKMAERALAPEELDALAVIAMAGIAAEALAFETVVGQNADLVDLQRMFAKSATKLTAESQMAVTRWAVMTAATALKTNAAAYDALREAMARGASVVECIQAIESH